ncbi:nucleotidase [Bacillus sp. 1NLA3E]|uniref:nucleotidase n=1 Tax=Bacillus sp. 1NLA3E TaxID=666686 RepID=UPI000247EEE8|nr:nucleotidase [Bacillus sp. 1NLA3E]AGK54939.1 nucleotidase [Bacillus sp. 1NLA3E]
MRKRFGIDIDGTVTCPSALIPYINSSFKLNLSLNDITQYDLTPFVNVSSEELAKWFLETEPEIYANSPLAKGAKEILTKWEQTHELFFISARSSDLLKITEDWFINNDLKFDHIDLIGSHHKIEAAKNHNVDVFFEDKHDNAVMIHEECNIPVILFNTPYNQNPIPDGVIRVNHWQEAYVWVEKWLKNG